MSQTSALAGSISVRGSTLVRATSVIEPEGDCANGTRISARGASSSFSWRTRRHYANDFGLERLPCHAELHPLADWLDAAQITFGEGLTDDGDARRCLGHRRDSASVPSAAGRP